MKITPIELKALGRFRECCEDSGSGGHDVPKEMMQRLMAVGTVRTLGFGRHETTEFGDWLLAQPPEAKAPVLASPAAAPQPIIGRLMDQISGLPVLWGLNEPGALLRNRDVFRVLAVAGREQTAIAAAPQVVADERTLFEASEPEMNLARDAEGEYENPCVASGWKSWQDRAALQSAPVHAQEPVAYADPKAFENFKSDIIANEWMWAEQHPGYVAMYAAPVQAKESVDSDEIIVPMMPAHLLDFTGNRLYDAAYCMGFKARAELPAPVQPVAVPDLISAIVIEVLEAARDFIGANAVPADAKGASESAHQARKMAALIDSVLAHLPAAPAAQVDAKEAS